MLTIILIILNIVISILGIYLFDYRVDSLINEPWVIVVSLLVGFLVMILSFFLYIEVFYFLVAKNKPINSKIKHNIAKKLMAVPLHVTNRRITIEGIENLPKNSGFSIYANHTSMMDIPVLMCALRNYPVAFLAKKMVVTLPAIGKWTTSIGCVMIDRTNDRKAAESIIQVIKNVKNGSTMVVFPEGTRTYNIGEMIDFKPGSFRIALKSRAPLVPITLSKVKHFNKISWPFRKDIKVVIHKPLEFADFKQLNTLDLAEKVKNIIQSRL